MPPSADRYLGIYLNDHLAGAAVGVGVARRLRQSNAGDPAMGRALADLCAEIEADRATLEELMDHLGTRRGKVKPALAAVGEWLGRLKPNGQLTGYSPLSRLVELELLAIGITGKMQLWDALGHALAERVGRFDFTELAARAARQRDTVAGLQLDAASRALSAG